MRIEDKIYGEFEVEGVLEELINTKVVQRLKNIHQGGASYLVNPNWNVTRYDHSVGTMIFIKIIGGSLEEQIAGLLHDISHTAFSHVVDFALNKSNEDYHEEIFERIVETSDIPKILTKYGYDYKDILYNETKWTLLERSAPALCADRIDYTLRDMYSYGYISLVAIKNFLDSLEVKDGEIVINSINAAEWFVNTYYKEVIGFFLNPLNIYAYNRLSNALKVALDNEIITLEDLLQDDNYVLTILKNSKNEEVRSLIQSLNYNVDVVENKEEYDIHQVNKLRLIDPTVIIDGVLSKASEKSTLIKILGEQAMQKSIEGVFVKFN
ncbi:HD domain-containing protein [Clostridium sp. NSJ-6]|uniref:HD domain-containing protein n=1 Tax=Clostridium hominis TaxID=2763036 RepID=A0ABR7DC84_9CLOT|nr:HD domain-containing protein [Clostridium hominis]MBC5629006.1 HD domain-containing protein [Clostridium hominis]MDU2671934.1 HD domain-containing protein [Clostridium sp.]